jgi:hypothetical protein
MALALFHLIRALSMKWILVPAKESFSSKKGINYGHFFIWSKKL